MTKVLPTDGFLRDDSGAIINVDNNKLQAYKLRREAENRKENEINTLKQEMSEIKSLLVQLLEKNNK
jgi:hypothetical protein